MKILWFANNACGSVRRHQGKVTIGGWLISLEDELKKYQGIELSVAFISPNDEIDFVFEGVHYYPITRPVSTNGLKRVLQRYETIESSDIRILPLLLDVVKKVKPDLIHIHGTEESFGLIQDYISDIPIVFSIQGLIAPYTEKFFSGLPMDRMKQMEPWSKRIRKVSFLDNYRSFQYRSERELHYLRNAHYVIGRTQFDHFIPLLCNPEVKLFQGEEILRNSFYDAKWEKKNFDTPFKIVSTVSGGIYKGYETALHAAGLMKRYANFEFEWQIIGYDDNSEWVRYAEQYKQINSREVGIKFHGRKEANEMVEIMKKADVFVQVSHIENSPNSLCEAMIMGMPIIASFAGGTSSMLTDGIEGILVQDGDPYTLAGALVQMYMNFDEAKEMGCMSRNRAMQRHDPASVAASVKRIYEEIIQII